MAAQVIVKLKVDSSAQAEIPLQRISAMKFVETEETLVMLNVTMET